MQKSDNTYVPTVNKEIVKNRFCDINLTWVATIKTKFPCMYMQTCDVHDITTGSPQEGSILLVSFLL